jgi:hypothetical protein
VILASHEEEKAEDKFEENTKDKPDTPKELGKAKKDYSNKEVG